MALPTPQGDDLSFFEWIASGAAAGAGFALGAVWRIAIKSGRLLSDVESLQTWRDKFELRATASEEKADRRHEDNLKEFRKIPTIEDFRHFEERMKDDLREIKESIGARSRRREVGPAE